MNKSKENKMETTTEQTERVESTEQTVDACEESTLEETKDTERNFKVSFESIDPTNLDYSHLYKCAKSAAGQVVQGLNHLSMHLTGEGIYKDNKKDAVNPFQTYLYPKISELSNEIVKKYNATFVDLVTDPLQLQVFGANLNGSRNNGQLNRFITCKSVGKLLRYQFAQLGQLLTLLHFRLAFIANRDSQSVKRYQENEEECKHFDDLRRRARQFCDYLKTVTFVQWSSFVSEARKFNEESTLSTNEEVPVKLTADSIELRENQSENQVQQKEHQYHVRNSSQDWKVVQGRNDSYSRQEYRTRSTRGRGRGSYSNGGNVARVVSDRTSGRGRYDETRTTGRGRYDGTRTTGRGRYDESSRTSGRGRYDGKVEKSRYTENKQPQQSVHVDKTEFEQTQPDSRSEHNYKYHERLRLSAPKAL